MNTTYMYIIIALVAVVVGAVGWGLLSTPMKNAIQYKTVTDGYRVNPYTIQIQGVDSDSSEVLTDKAKCLTRTVGGVAYSLGSNDEGTILRIITKDACTSDNQSDCVVADEEWTTYSK